MFGENMDDVTEAKVLLAQATRPAVQALLAQFIEANTVREVEDMMALDEPPAVAPPVTLPPPSVPMEPMEPVQQWVTPSYGWEQGEYNSPWVNVFVNIEVPKSEVTCAFTSDSFDLKAQNYRLLVETLEKDIVPDESKFVVKKNKVIVKLKKLKGEYSYDQWQELKKKGGKAAKDKSKDPTAGIMDLMKDLYDNGDDSMRKIIGESMLKQRNGEKVEPDDLSSNPIPNL